MLARLCILPATGHAGLHTVLHTYNLWYFRTSRSQRFLKRKIGTVLIDILYACHRTTDHPYLRTDPTDLCAWVHWHGKLLQRAGNLDKVGQSIHRHKRIRVDTSRRGAAQLWVTWRGMEPRRSLPCSRAKAKDITRSRIRAWRHMSCHNSLKVNIWWPTTAKLM